MTIHETGRDPPLSIYALELHAVRHCNLSCEGCAQNSPQLSAEYEDVDVMERALGNLAGSLACQKLQVLGGEPLLHPKLIDILKVASKSCLASELSVKTNGLLLTRMPDSFWQLVNHVIVSVYPATEKALSRTRSELGKRAAAQGTVLSFRNFEAFRHITKPVPTASTMLVRHIFQRCQYKHFTHSLRAGKIYRCAPSVNLTDTDSMTDHDGDSISVLDTVDLRARLDTFLTSTNPLGACRSCLGSSGGTFAHNVGPKRR